MIFVVKFVVSDGRADRQIKRQKFCEGTPAVQFKGFETHWVYETTGAITCAAEAK